MSANFTRLKGKSNPSSSPRVQQDTERRSSQLSAALHSSAPHGDKPHLIAPPAFNDAMSPDSTSAAPPAPIIMVDTKDVTVDDGPAAPVAAAYRVFGTPELLEKILGHLDVVEIFKFQRVNTTFNNIFTIAPHLLRTMGVQASLQGGAPSEHVEEFGPLVIGLKNKELLIRPYRFGGVSTNPRTGERWLSFLCNVDIAKYAQDRGTIMGRAGKSGKDYDASYSWANIVVATSPFKIEFRTVYPCGSGSSHTFSSPPGVTTMRTVFKALQKARDESIEQHEEHTKMKYEQAMKQATKDKVRKLDEALAAIEAVRNMPTDHHGCCTWSKSVLDVDEPTGER